MTTTSRNIVRILVIGALVAAWLGYFRWKTNRETTDEYPMEVSEPGRKGGSRSAAGELGATSFLPPEQQRLAAAEASFAFKLLRRITEDSGGKNILIAPQSVSAMLQAVCYGARGQTKAEMQGVLETTEIQTNDLWKEIKERQAATKGREEAIKKREEALGNGGQNVVLGSAIGIWCRKGTVLSTEFTSVSQELFGAEVKDLDFDDPHSVGIMNAWAANKTFGKIPRIVEGPIGPLTRLFLISAVYFKGGWDQPFDAKETKERPFHLRGGTDKSVQMMKQKRKFTYSHSASYQGVRLAYRGSALSMCILLPDAGSSVEKLLQQMNGAGWYRDM